ncbi:MAG: response regulator [Myxococcales bacterium]|nr:response regulator [Myxococcales bacterium]
MDGAEEVGIVCSNNTEVLRMLDSISRTRTLPKVQVASTKAELQELIQWTSPSVAILDTTLPDGSGFELCRTIRSSAALASTQVILVHPDSLDEQAATNTRESGANDIVVLPIHSDSFSCHINQFTSAYGRSVMRVPVAMDLELSRNGTTLIGSVQNMTTNGLGILLGRAIDTGPVNVTLHHGDKSYSEIEGRIIWCRPSSDGSGHSVGLKFGKVPGPAQALLVQLSLFQVSKNSDGAGITVALQGGFDDRTDFAPLLEAVREAEHIDFMMQRVDYLSSCGVRSWCLFIEALAPGVTYDFRNCSLAFSSQAAMVPMSIGKGEVVSMQAPYFCDPCDREDSRLIETRVVRRTTGDLVPPPLHCHICKKTLDFDDIPGRYFAFLGQ